ncbi:hypothetical protein ACFY3J_28300 [Streptomyces sp. NPDC001231]|uniref:hypothetical protein n=1 Tax=Streptomyces sp. NPDC001231 TaxID=3364549 RepID=UPI0036BBCF36
MEGAHCDRSSHDRGSRDRGNPGDLPGAGACTLAVPPIEVKDPPYEDTLYYEDTL